jgi:hypothetical protein
MVERLAPLRHHALKPELAGMLEDKRTVFLVHASLKKSKPWQGALGRPLRIGNSLQRARRVLEETERTSGRTHGRMFGTQRLTAGYVLPPHSRKSALIGEWNLCFGEGG